MSRFNLKLAIVGCSALVHGGAQAQECVLRFEQLSREFNFVYTKLVSIPESAPSSLYAPIVYLLDPQTSEVLDFIEFARWNGERWVAGGRYPGLRFVDEVGYIYDLCMFDDGSGPAMYGCGRFSANEFGEPMWGVARWSGEKWVAVGGGVLGQGYAMTVFDDGRGPALYVGGWFAEAGGRSASNIARWDGDQWTDVGGGVGGGREYVKDLVVFDDGSGPALFAGGWFEWAAPAQPSEGVAKWTGEEWIPIGARTQGTRLHHTLIEDMIVHDDGAGPALYVCGNMADIAGMSARGIARWDGARWSNVGDTSEDRFASIDAMAVFDDGSGPRLYADGVGWSRGTAVGLAMWDGESWHDRTWYGEMGLGPETMAVLNTPEGQELWLSDHTYYPPLGLEPVLGRLRCASPSCDTADCDHTGSLDFFDYLCFQNAFAAADPGADCDKDGALAFTDFLCFQNAFAAGCP